VTSRVPDGVRMGLGAMATPVAAILG
jgi:hypothetical protein